MLYFIVNPVSGKGNGMKTANKIKEALAGRDDYEIVFTEYAGHAPKLAEEYSDKEDCTGIIAVGGDGTFNEVLNGINLNVPLGFISSGSGNDFFRSFMPDSCFEKQLDKILKGNTDYVDFIKVDDKRGLNVTGAGFDIDILLLEKKLHKYFGGSVGYFLALIITLFTMKFRNFKIEINGKTIEEQCLIMSVSNGKYFGGGLPISLGSDVKDGILDVVLIKKMPKHKIPYMLIKFLKGKLSDVTDYVDVYHCTSVKTSITPTFKMQIDGEIYDNSDFQCEVVHNQLKVFM